VILKFKLHVAETPVLRLPRPLRDTHIPNIAALGKQSLHLGLEAPVKGAQQAIGMVQENQEREM